MLEVPTMESMALSLVDPGRRVSVRELERWASLAAASAVIAYGFSRRTVPGHVSGCRRRAHRVQGHRRELAVHERSRRR